MGSGFKFRKNFFKTTSNLSQTPKVTTVVLWKEKIKGYNS